MLRRFVVGFVVLGLAGAGCSSSGGEVSGPEASSVAGSSAEETVVESTVVESLTGLEDVLDGEPPSTTVSADVDEQTAADVVHWNAQTYFECNVDLNACDLTSFEEVRQGKYLADTVVQLQGERDRGESVLPDAREPESRVLWARTSSTNPDVVGVLACERNYYVQVDADGAVIDDSSPVYLELWRVEKNDSGRFRVSLGVTIDKFQPDSEGEDVCSKYEGTEVSDAVFAELVR